jgi:hypothetical protein
MVGGMHRRKVGEVREIEREMVGGLCCGNVREVVERMEEWLER